MVTASHNPPKWNGIKFKESYGGAASGEYLQPIEERIIKNEKTGRTCKTASLRGNPLLEYFDPYKEYLECFKKMVDLDLIEKQKFKILVDPLYGTGAGYFPRLLGNNALEIHNQSDTNFGGLNPEPIPPNTNELTEKMKTGNYHVGLLTDGDADRAGAVDEYGNVITTHEIFCLLIKHLVENKNWIGKIIKSISTTMMINRLGKKYNLEVRTVPVGFKHISPAMKEPGVLIGGEESGGFGIPRHIPERDGIFSCLLLLELMAVAQKSMNKLVKELQEEVGPAKYRRLDMHLEPNEIELARKKIRSLDIKTFCGLKVVQKETMDGLHFLFEDDSWLLYRASGTEPLIRVYAETPTVDQTNEFIAQGKKLIGL